MSWLLKLLKLVKLVELIQANIVIWWFYGNMSFTGIVILIFRIYYITFTKTFDVCIKFNNNNIIIKYNEYSVYLIRNI